MLALHIADRVDEQNQEWRTGGFGSIQTLPVQACVLCYAAKYVHELSRDRKGETLTVGKLLNRGS